jgi:hypothetical protein
MNSNYYPSLEILPISTSLNDIVLWLPYYIRWDIALSRKRELDVFEIVSKIDFSSAFKESISKRKSLTEHATSPI